MCVSWEEAATYAQWLSKQTGKHYRLMTAAEFDSVVRKAPTGACKSNLADASFNKKYDSRDGADCDDGYAGTSPVGHFGGVAGGIADIDGNVRTWVGACGNGVGGRRRQPLPRFPGQRPQLAVAAGQGVTYLQRYVRRRCIPEYGGFPRRTRSGKVEKYGLRGYACPRLSRKVRPMKLLFPNGEHEPVELKDGDVLVGSGADCQVMLAAPGIGMRHCVLRTRGENTIVKPGDAQSVTVLNGKQITGETSLKPGDSVAVRENRLPRRRRGEAAPYAAARAQTGRAARRRR